MSVAVTLLAHLTPNDNLQHGRPPRTPRGTIRTLDRLPRTCRMPDAGQGLTLQLLQVLHLLHAALPPRY